MATNFLLLSKFSVLGVLLALATTHPTSCSCHYTSIFSFGDSLIDTGNLLRLQHNNASFECWFPYGITYFHHPTGRCSDGRLIIHFIAEYLGLPFVPPYLSRGSGGQDFRHGMNFAVGGATALDYNFNEHGGTHDSRINNSLAIQLRWFKELLPSLCDSDSKCRDLFSRSLFIVGEIGGNDYSLALNRGRSLEEIKSLVPRVINNISSAIQMFIQENGAVTLLVPGHLPYGCFPVLLTDFQSPNEEDYESETGCLRWLNQLSEFTNHLLQEEIHRLRHLHPHVTIIYADLYNAVKAIFRSPDKFGFRKGALLLTCCGGEGPYSYNKSIHCGDRGAKGPYNYHHSMVVGMAPI